MHESTLNVVGRGVALDDFYRAYEIARDSGADVNIDLIYGLSGEGDERFLSSVERVLALKPHNITLHALAYKRNAEIFACKAYDKNRKAAGYEQAYDRMRAVGYEPYYLYRQKYSAGGAENTGFCLPGREGIYNQMIISEKIGIIGLGAGALGKIYLPAENRVERIEGYKNIDLYIKNIDEVLEKKRERVKNIDKTLTDR